MINPRYWTFKGDNKISKFMCNKLGWHVLNRVSGNYKEKGEMRCKWCYRKLLRDSQGNYFSCE